MQRVVYVDIDIHHGDGVEEDFNTTDRVMTVSFHKFGGNFFPGIGHIKDIGAGTGKYYALNTPLKDGIDDESFRRLLRLILEVFNVPLMILGGGGYTVNNVARCWCYETTVAVGVEPEDPEYTLNIEPLHMKNMNTPHYLEVLRNKLMENVLHLPHTSSVPFQQNN